MDLRRLCHGIERLDVLPTGKGTPGTEYIHRYIVMISTYVSAPMESTNYKARVRG